MAKLTNYKDQIISLYNKVNNNPFYTRDVKDVFPPERIHMLTGKGYLTATGEYYIGTDHARKYNQWQFSKKGVAFVESFQ